MTERDQSTVEPPAEAAWDALHKLRLLRDELNAATPPGTPSALLAMAFAALAQADYALRGLAREQ